MSSFIFIFKNCIVGFNRKEKYMKAGKKENRLLMPVIYSMYINICI